MLADPNGSPILTPGEPRTMLFPESTPKRRVKSPEEKARDARRILELQIKHDRMPAACRGPIAEELAKLQQRRALERVAGDKPPRGLGL